MKARNSNKKPANPFEAVLSVSYKANYKTVPALAIPKTNDALFSLFMDNSVNGCWIYDENNFIIFANSAYLNSLEFTDDPIGKHITEVMPKSISEKLIERNKIMFQTNEPHVSEYSFTRGDGEKISFVSNAFVFTATDNKKYIGGQAIDITERTKVEEISKKANERFIYAINATSEAIWDLDLLTDEIYRSDAFYKISGYNKEQVEGNINWWFNKIHQNDKQRVIENFKTGLANGKKTWSDEYRFLYADGSYRTILDKAFAIYGNGVPIRLIGAIQDITEKKKLESQLINDQLRKQKTISQATIEAQEKERSMISAELHDNVNQLLMSAKLHIGAAKNNENQNELLDNASKYLLQAVEEIRSLSKRLNTSIIKVVGLHDSIMDISRNIKLFNDIDVTVQIDKKVVEKLSHKQQLVIYRIIQEQSNNIIKYSRASATSFILTEKNNTCHLVVSDNGIGFDKEKQKPNGIGLINMFNRVDAYNGTMEIITYPDNGCTINVTLPYMF